MDSSKFTRTLLIVSGILILLSCSKNKTDSLPHNQMYSFNSKVEKSLLSKYDALLLPGSDPKIFNDYLNKLFANSIVIDTTIIDFQKTYAGYKLIAESKKDFGEKIILTLECTKDQFEKYQKFKCQSAYIAASINMINKQEVFADIDTLSNEKSLLILGKEILLAGTCLEIIETPTIYFYGGNKA
ncbi:MAG: hypothetical protein JEY94_11350 [Melioribacteraceae bacterium]|nr:hypothetical protein [Melioribacteraceae bacterium]